MQNKNNLKFIIVFIIILIALAGVGIFAYSVWQDMDYLNEGDDTTEIADTEDKAPFTPDNLTEGADLEKETDNTDETTEIESDSDSYNQEQAKGNFDIGAWNITGNYKGNHRVSYSLKTANDLTFSSDELSEDCADYKIAGINRRTGSQKMDTIYNSANADSVVLNQTVSEYFAGAGRSLSIPPKHIGDYYYFFISSHGACSSMSSDISIEHGILVDLQKYFDTLAAK